MLLVDEHCRNRPISHSRSTLREIQARRAIEHEISAHGDAREVGR
jgi:hypothetical protein